MSFIYAKYRCQVYKSCLTLIRPTVLIAFCIVKKRVVILTDHYDKIFTPFRTTKHEIYSSLFLTCILFRQPITSLLKGTIVSHYRVRFHSGTNCSLRHIPTINHDWRERLVRLQPMVNLTLRCKLILVYLSFKKFVSNRPFR